MTGKKCWCTSIAMILLIIGGLNWGLVGAFRFDLVKYLLGDMTMWTRIVYGLVGLSALCLIIKHFSGSCCK